MKRLTTVRDFINHSHTLHLKKAPIWKQQTKLNDAPVAGDQLVKYISPNGGVCYELEYQDHIIKAIGANDFNLCGEFEFWIFEARRDAPNGFGTFKKGDITIKLVPCED